MDGRTGPRRRGRADGRTGRSGPLKRGRTIERVDGVMGRLGGRGDAKSEASNPWSRGRGWRWRQEKARVANLELDVFHNPKLHAYPGWEQQPQPWSVATAMKYVGFPHFDCL